MFIPACRLRRAAQWANARQANVRCNKPWLAQAEPRRKTFRRPIPTAMMRHYQAAATMSRQIRVSCERLHGSPPKSAWLGKEMARVTGLEPATSGVTGRHSNRLSYTRALRRKDRTSAFRHSLKMARVTGLEPATSGVTGRHSNRLSYTRTSFQAIRRLSLPSPRRAGRFDERLTKGFAFECQAGLETKR